MEKIINEIKFVQYNIPDQKFNQISSQFKEYKCKQQFNYQIQYKNLEQLKTLLYDNQYILSQYFKCRKQEQCSNDQQSLIFYTDGGSRPSSQGKGGCCSILLQNNYIIESRMIGSIKTTNNRMELLAILQTLISSFELHQKGIKFNNIYIHSDSNYSIDSCVSWMQKWIQTKRIINNVKNPDLIIQIYLLISCLQYLKINVIFVKVKGHNGIQYNEMCDKGCAIINGQGQEFMGYGTYQEYLWSKL